MFGMFGPRPKVITVGNGRYDVSTIQTHVDEEVLMKWGEEYETVVFDKDCGGCSAHSANGQSWGEVLEFRQKMREMYGE